MSGMTYEVMLSQKSEKALDKMKKKDSSSFEMIIDALKNMAQNPEQPGKPLKENLKGLWSHRAGDFRIIYQILKAERIILVIAIGHRRDVYDRI